MFSGTDIRLHENYKRLVEILTVNLDPDFGQATWQLISQLPLEIPASASEWVEQRQSYTARKTPWALKYSKKICHRISVASLSRPLNIRTFNCLNKAAVPYFTAALWPSRYEPPDTNHRVICCINAEDYILCLYQDTWGPLKSLMTPSLNL